MANMSIAQVAASDVYQKAYDQRLFDLVEFEFVHVGFDYDDPYVVDILSYMDDAAYWRCGADDCGGTNDELISQAENTVWKLFDEIEKGETYSAELPFPANMVHVREALKNFLACFPTRPVLVANADVYVPPDAPIKTPPKTKTAEELAKLKRAWRADPCWDIEYAHGFEVYRDELKVYRLQCEAEWKAATAKRHLILASDFGLPGNETFGRTIEVLMNRIEELSRELNAHVNG